MKNSSGYFSMIAATVIWGNLALVFAHIKFVPVVDIISHRVIWGFLTLMIWVSMQGRLKLIADALGNPKTLLILIISAAVIALNWLGFVYAFTHGHGIEAGIGYFIYPLASIAFGAIFNGERIDPVLRVAIGIAALGVLVLTLGLGRAPWISLFIALTFAVYGLIKSRMKIGAVISVSAETVLLLPFAIIWLLLMGEYTLSFQGNMAAAFWLVFSGVLTAIALIGFSYATKTIGLVATGMLFFINPTLQVFNAALILSEPLTIWHQIAFPLIGLACAIYCWDLWKSNH